MDIAAPPTGYQRLSSGRRSELGRIYLVTTVAYQRKSLFADWHAGWAMSRLISDPMIWPEASLICWVLMPDHWHGLVSLNGRTSLPALIKRAKGSSARDFNRLFDRSGSVWADGFHDRALRREENLRDAARYVIGNPLRAGLVSDFRDYPFWNAVWL